MEINQKNIYSVEQVITYRGKVNNKLINNVMSQLLSVINDTGLKINGPTITAIYSIENDCGDQIIDIEIIVSINGVMASTDEFVYRDRFEISNALMFRHIGNPLTMNTEMQEFNQYIRDNDFKPVTPFYNVISVILLVLYGIIVFCYNKPIKKINEKQMEENSQVTSYLVESLNGIETVKAFNAEKKAEYKTEKLFIKFLKSIFKGGFLSNSQQSLTNAVYVIGETVILWVGTVKILNGELTVGELITFNALLAYFLDPVKNLINLQPTMQTAIVAADRLGEILDLEPEKKENEESKIKDVSLNKKIEISNLDFRYGTRQFVLKNINLTINPGEKIALVGESGSGKTTLVKLLMNFYEFEKGEIMFGDYNIKDINIESLRDKIAYISQDIFLFSGTIRENLMLGNEDATLDEIIEACKLSKANEFIEKMPLRYDTMLEENGANLSGGQKQRLAIARALLKKPDILIMDEATSNLDSITEKAIEKTINELSDNITTVIIAHRLSTIMRCDKIYVMADGEIIEQGSHTQLMNDRKSYYNLWKEQLPVQNGGEDHEEHDN